jgi:hypothetical protein
MIRPRHIQIAIVLATMTALAFTLPHLSSATATPASAALAALPTIAVTPPEAVATVAVTPAREAQPAEAQPAAALQAVPTVQPLPVTALPDSLPDLQSFAASLQDNSQDSGQAVGVYAPGLLAMRIVHQPPSDITYIDAAPDVVTEYQLARDAGSLGLMAHNYSGGAAFAGLQTGQSLWVTYAGGQASEYRIERIHRYQALNPADPYANLIDLQTGGEKSSSAVFGENYTEGTLVLQTCIEQNGDWSWGRLFIIARPVG